MKNNKRYRNNKKKLQNKILKIRFNNSYKNNSKMPKYKILKKDLKLSIKIQGLEKNEIKIFEINKFNFFCNKNNLYKYN